MANSDPWEREWQIQMGYDTDPNKPGGGAVLRDKNKTNIFRLERVTLPGLTVRAYRVAPDSATLTTTTKNWKGVVFIEMGSAQLVAPKVNGKSKPWDLYKTPQPGTAEPVTTLPYQNHKKLVKNGLAKVRANTVRLVGAIQVKKKPPGQPSYTVIEHVFLYYIKNAFKVNGAYKYLLLIDLKDTTEMRPALHQNGGGGGLSRP